ncbi:methyltransferase domain-containing protein [Streptomyces armeniacus]|uniref:Methyltransferase domain-containing protein n=1 Tax=Streptomyces armeniacus TaxID=83291 RepID=A0A345XI51_9ACTN|nr:methyltransferase domain-containing protein [Streptomyces armeniacus]AXK31317.1 methyltransferase domain-containing protein [Streptomyces armeniacus]
MSASADSFDHAIDAWREWQASPWGRLRYALAEHNLARHTPALGRGPLRVLDLAGADGADAVPLAVRGHHVTVVDYSPGMLAAARDRARAADAGERLATVLADVLDLPAEVRGATYDLVLCHNLLQYQEEPGPVLRTVVPLVRPGGLLSVMAINRHSAPLALAVRSLDPAAALRALGERQSRSATFDAGLTLHTAEEITAELTVLGCTGVRHYGIRTVADHITDDARKRDPAFYADLEALELALTDREPYVHTARIFHLVAGVPGGGPAAG